MVITYHGGQCFKLTYGDTTVAFDPPGKKSSVGSVKFGADVVMVSMQHENFNGVESVSYGAKQAFVIDGPGEYEVGEATARGYGIETTYDKASRFATLFQVRLEGMNIVFLGPISSDQIDPKILGELGDIDILMVPVGGGDVLDVPAASKLATKLEAKCILPMHYDAKALDAFLKEEGVSNGKPVDKLTIKKKDLATMEGDIVVLKS